MPRPPTLSPAHVPGTSGLDRGDVLSPAGRGDRTARRALARIDRRLLGTLGLVGMLATGIGMVLIAAAGANPRLVNASRAGFPDWMSGVFGHIAGKPSEVSFYALLLAMAGCYLLVLACARSVSARVALGIVVVLHLLFLLAPPLLSRDVFNYISYARIGAVHGLNPYLHGAGSSPFDPSYPFICCHHYANPYGPLFTLGSYAIVPFGAHAMLWLLKAAVALAGLGCVALVWKGARLQGRDPVAPALLVGLNPVWLVLTVGGAHNDLLMEVFAVGGIVLWLAGRQAAGTATVVVGLATKISAAVILPFMLVASDRRLRALVAATLTGLALIVLWLAVFGLDAPRGFGGAIGQQQQLFSQRSIPQQLGVLFGLGQRPQEIRLPLDLVALGVIAWLLWRTWRGADWIASAGWATFALLATTAWLLPWYVVWLLPLAALGDDRRLRIAALVATAYLIWARTPLILG
jgi:hypothetical protein